jgi:hypothetical protein
MKTSFWIFIFFIFICADSFSQEKIWKLDVFNFLDNSEFGRSALKIPQTMAGVIVAPEAGLGWDSVHKVIIGVNLMHEYGSIDAIDKFYPTAYYEYYRESRKFIIGAFPRIDAIEKYPRLFFQDSISYYRPNINGTFFEYRQDQSYINIWLDWTGRQTSTVNEAFFIGISGRITRDIFYLQDFGYMFHFAEKKDPLVEEALHDNMLNLISLGTDLSERTGLKKLEANAGWVLGLERARLDNTGWIMLNGLLIETKVEYKRFGLFNTFYAGDGLMYYYEQYGNKLYWGDPVYRAKIYNRSDFYVNLLDSRRVNIEFTYSLHFLENRMYNQQMLKVIVNLDSQKN